MSFAIDWYSPKSDKPEDISAAERTLQFNVRNKKNALYYLKLFSIS